MEFQEALMKLVIRKTDPSTKQSPRLSVSDAFSKVRRKWKIPQPPPEFLCSISGSLMADPVIVSSGHTFERACVLSCKALRFSPTLPDSSTPNFTTAIPNLALKSSILAWCRKWSKPPPKPLHFATAQLLVRKLMASDDRNENPPLPTHLFSSSDDSSLDMIPLPRLSASYSFSTSSSEISNHDPDEEELVAKLRSPLASNIEDGVLLLRTITRDRQDARVHLCSFRILLALRPLIVSMYRNIQVNSVAALVNLSLEKVNKVKILRSRLVLPLVDVLKGGFPEAQEHACGAVFSLALDDENKTAIGVLGALPPLIHLLRSHTERTRQDSALALYHLSLVQNNVSKLVKLGSVNVLLGMVRSGHMVGRVLMILRNMALCVDGRAAMLDAGAVGCLVGILRSGEEEWRENSVAALYGLSQCGLRFKGLAKAAGMVEELRKVEGSEMAKEKAARMVEMMRVRVAEEAEEEVDWEELLDLGLHPNKKPDKGMEWFNINSAEF